MRYLKINKTNLDLFLSEYVKVKNKTSGLSSRLRRHVLSQFEVAKQKGWIKEENGKIFKYVEKKNE